jgi:hypothetical protein
MALRACALTFIQGPPCRHITFGLLRRPLSGETADVRDDSPELGLGEPIAWHLRTFYTSPDRSEQIAITASHSILAGGQVNSAAAFSRWPVTEGAVPEKVLSSARYVGGSVMRILLRNLLIRTPVFGFLPRN